jgi:signal transduction histidine kinase
VATTMAEHALVLEAEVADGLRRSQLDNYLERAHEASKLLVRNLERAATLVASFKQLAVDHTASVRSIFSLNDMLDELVPPLRITIAQRPIKVVSSAEPGLTMDSFHGPLTQVLDNLIDNCLLHAFKPEQAGTIHLLAARRSDDLVAISVVDDGMGIPPELIGRIYDPFFTTKLGSGGSGLGLHVAHNIVTGVLGGRIELLSEPGAGTSFTLVLPVVAPGFATRP